MILASGENEMPKFVLRFNGIKLKEIPINKGVIAIGRQEDNDVVIDNLAVSRRHAQLVQKGDKFILEDLNSFNGTFVNDKKIDACELKDGDTILIGKHTLVFLVGNKEYLGATAPESGDETLVLSTKKQRELLTKDLEQKAEEVKKPGGLKGIIYYITDNGDVQEVKLNKRVTTVGKGENADIRVKGFFIGKAALLINKREKGFYVSRGDGMSSPRLNGEKIKGQVKLRENDLIEIGSTTLRFSIKAF